MSNLASMIDVRSVRYSCSFVLVFYQWLALFGLQTAAICMFSSGSLLGPQPVAW